MEAEFFDQTGPISTPLPAFLSFHHLRAAAERQCRPAVAEPAETPLTLRRPRTHRGTKRSIPDRGVACALTPATLGKREGAKRKKPKEQTTRKRKRKRKKKKKQKKKKRKKKEKTGKRKKKKERGKRNKKKIKEKRGKGERKTKTHTALKKNPNTNKRPKQKKPHQTPRV
ncbi:hypothetical protein llap_2060 [Limosa lapponica baueri]|uniref:Uncharacterized protein n=1 Tax=Limosa lapponica baueri TaxID=1758121 RepID=A0A2I0UNN3_LIMLA|nr:hypothetical protein llap_2060 [Limosa lapponica baueri]